MGRTMMVAVWVAAARAMLAPGAGAAQAWPEEGPPEPGASGSVWCEASHVLLEGENPFDEHDLDAVPDPDAYYAHCRGGVPRRE